MTTHADRLTIALRDANPAMFAGVPLAATVQERDALYERMARRLVGLGVRLHQGDWAALREEPLRDNALQAAELETNLVTVERVSNGYLIRHLPSARSVVITTDMQGMVAGTADMLVYVNEMIGEVGGPYAPECVRVIVLPGGHWTPADAGDCLHLWVERLSPKDDWFCPCGAKFRLEHEGRSRADSAAEPALE
jgi:hypothetical protein